MSHSISFISVINYIASFKKPCELLEFSLSTRHLFFLGSCLSQFFKNLVRAHATCQQLLQHSLCFGLLSFFSSLSICFCLLRFQGCHFFFGLLQSRLLLFQCVLLLLNRFLDGCDLGIQRRNSPLLLYDLGCIVFGDIGFRTVLLPFVLGMVITSFLLLLFKYNTTEILFQFSENIISTYTI